MAPELSVVLPSYMEEENLRILLPRLAKSLDTENILYEIVVIDTTTKLDDTKNVCLESNANYFHREGGDTYGDAIRTGISKARGKFIIFMDADGSHQPEFIQQLFAQRNDYDVVIASRYIKGGVTENSKPLILMSKIVNIGYSLILGIKCKDVSNSFKLYNGDELRSLRLTCNNFDVVEEILYKLIKRNRSLKMKELPFTFKQRMFGQTKRNLVAFIFGYVVTLIKLRVS